MLVVVSRSLLRTSDRLRAKYAHLVDRPILEDEPIAPKPTPAMLACAAASDAREAFPFANDDEEGDRLHRLGGAGYVEATLAMDA